uniref:Uncharacterized protein n=1 Tax=Leersia perrieri TaxID=77586 RepID=A0A0D9WGH5_9ORYZ
MALTAAASGFHLQSISLLPSPCLLSSNPSHLSPRLPVAPTRRRRGREPGTVRCAKRTGKRRYPSEKKRLDRRQKELLRQAAPEEGSAGREAGYWRLSKLAVPARDDPGKDFTGVSPPLLQAIAKALKFPVSSMLPEEAFSVIHKSFDARKFFHTVIPSLSYLCFVALQRDEIATWLLVVTQILDAETSKWCTQIGLTSTQ